MGKKSKIYVAGHKGMVGSAIIRKLQEKGYTNIIIRTHQELDLTDQKATREFFEKEKPEYVFLAAAKVGGIKANITYPVEFLYENLMIQANVLKNSFEFNVKKLIFLGSSCIYPRESPQPMKEEYLLSGKLEPTNEGYALAKITGLKLCEYYYKEYGKEFLSVMPPNLYGPGDNFNLESSHVLSALIRKFHLAKLLKEKKYEEIKNDISKIPIGFGLDKKAELWNIKDLKEILEHIGITESKVKIWGTGNARREFLYVDDLADALLYFMEKINVEDIRNISKEHFVNIGVGYDITIKDLAGLIKDIVGFEGDIYFDKSKPDGMPQKLLDISNLSKLGWKHKIDLEEGIKRTYEWYLDNYSFKKEW